MHRTMLWHECNESIVACVSACVRANSIWFSYLDNNWFNLTRWKSKAAHIWMFVSIVVESNSSNMDVVHLNVQFAYRSNGLSVCSLPISNVCNTTYTKATRHMSTFVKYWKCSSCGGLNNPRNAYKMHKKCKPKLRAKWRTWTHKDSPYTLY